jgi:hypothetical protein
VVAELARDLAHSNGGEVRTRLEGVAQL